MAPRVQVRQRATKGGPRRAVPGRAAAAAQDGGQESDAPKSNVEELEARLGIGRKRRSSQTSVAQQQKPAQESPKTQPKDWESRSLPEKAVELWAGNKGALYWLNKLAVWSLYILVGSWVAFRFIGPALGLYQLESPLLPPNEAM
eukprot:SM000111S18800  [mRNA]  locus=s111:255334:256342:+ [translate_table: standard]